MRKKEKKRKREASNRIVEKATEAKWYSTSGNDSRGNYGERKRENAKRERRALHFIAAASSLFIADIRLYGIYPPYSPRDSVHYVRQ